MRPISARLWPLSRPAPAAAPTAWSASRIPASCEAARKRTGLSAGQMAMVGDRLYTDIETGLKSGMLSILVMSGETTPQMLAEYPNKPDLVFDRLADMIPLL